MRLSLRQQQAFFDTGWIVLPSVFTATEMARAQAAFERLGERAQRLRETQSYAGSYFVLQAPEQGEVVIQRVVWAGGCEPDLLELSADPRLVQPALQLLGSDRCEQLLCQAHFKMPGDGVSFDWHQDIQHRDKGPGTWRDINGRGSYVQTITLIDDMTEDNGPLQFIPRSAVRGDAEGRIFGSHYDYGAPMQDDSVAPDIDVSAAVTITGESGSVLLFGPYAVHGSTANTSTQSRRVLINGYAYPGANGRVYPGEGSGRVLALA
jgi:ectoine hydroxylase